MKQLLLYLINPCLPLAIYIIGCNSSNYVQEEFSSKNSTSKATHTTPSKHNKINNSVYKDYTALTEEIRNEKNKLIPYYRNAETADYGLAAEKYITLFEQKLIPSWIGTKWDFNGITRIPKNGSIACGYFVTTTLHDMGIDINIAKYAQCGSDVMVKHLIEQQQYANLSNLTFDAFIKKLKEQKPFLAIVGLDFHTGYLLNNGKELYFIHSSYKNRRGVVKEIAANSTELKSSKWKSIGYLTNDNKFMQNWLSH